MSVLWTQSAWSIPWLVTAGGALLAGYTDLRSHRIPNLLTIPLLAGGLVWSSTACGWAGLGDALGGCVLMGLPYVLLYAFAGGGAGDAKLAGALGSWLGVWGGMIALGSVAITGGALAIGYAWMRKSSRPLAGNIGAAAMGVAGLARGVMRKEDAAALMPAAGGSEKMPYGAAFAAGMVFAGVGVWLWRV